MKKKGMASLRKAGFTLIEVLVTIVVIGVLAAVVIPAVTSQVTAGDSARVFNDITGVRTGIENFDIAVKQFPGDVDDLVNKIGQSVSSTGANVDADISGALYVSTVGWAGPYMEAVLSASSTSSTLPNASTPAFNTGYSATVNNAFLGCDILTLTACTGGTPNYVTVQVNALTASQASTLNDLIDGVGESASATSGKWRVVTSSGSSTGYYYATPFK